MAIAYASNATAGGNLATVNLTLPATINSGDLLLFFWEYQNTTTPTETDPTGWTSLFTILDAGTSSLGGWYKVADGTEGGTTVSRTCGTGNRQSLVAVRYTGVNASTPIDVIQTGVESVSQTGHVLPTAIAGTTGSVGLKIMGERNSTTTTNWAQLSGHTERVDFNTAGTGGTSIAIDEMNSTLNASDSFGGETWSSTAAGLGYSMVVLGLKPAPTGNVIPVPEIRPSRAAIQRSTW